MSLEDRFAQHDKEVVDKFINPAAAVQMNTWDYIVRPSADGDSGPWVLTLPPVAEAKGRFYSIICRNADAVNTITVTHDSDSECWTGDVVLNGKCDKILCYSDGLAWFVAESILTYTGTTPTPTTVGPTTVGPTVGPTTIGPTSIAPTTVASQTTSGSTTPAPTTTAPTSLAPTTTAPTSLAPTTVAG